MLSCLAGGDAAAHDYVRSVFDNVVVQPRDAREASDVFYKQKVSGSCCRPHAQGGELLSWMSLFP